MKSEGIPTPEKEFRFHELRKWRFDFCWPTQKIAVEIQGGIWKNGGHNRALGYLRDCEKLNEAQLLGYRVLYVCKEHIDNGLAIQWVKSALSKGGC